MITLKWRDIQRMAAVHLGVLQVGLGTSIIAGGPERFPAPTYSTLLSVVDGHVWSYGLATLAVGIGLLVPSPRANLVSHMAAVLVMNVLSGLFFVAITQDPNAASTAWWAYFSLGTIHGFNIALVLAHRKQERGSVAAAAARRGDG